MIPATHSLVKNGISTKYNQVWEAKGSDEDEVDPENGAPLCGRMILLDGDGLSGDGDAAKTSEEELLSDPETLKMFVKPHAFENACFLR